jgi:hypothetical protein
MCTGAAAAPPAAEAAHDYGSYTAEANSVFGKVSIGTIQVRRFVTAACLAVGRRVTAACFAARCRTMQAFAVVYTHELLLSRSVTLTTAHCCAYCHARCAQMGSLLHRAAADKRASDEAAAAAQADAAAARAETEALRDEKEALTAQLVSVVLHTVTALYQCYCYEYNELL